MSAALAEHPPRSLRRDPVKGFKEFILRGNVIQLAVAVIIGAAFTTIVNAIVEGIINPLIAALFNADDLAAAVWQIGGVSFAIGLVLSAVINFVLVALVVYFVIIVPVNKLNEAAYVRKHGHKPSDEEASASEAELLTEIRDLLAVKKS
jgi:large conductance mechanosensitive channel